MAIKALGLSLYGQLAASTRYRLTQYAPGLKEHGIELTVSALLGDSYLLSSFAGKKYPLTDLMGDYFDRLALLCSQRDYDVAIVNAELFPLLPGFVESRLLRIPYIYDFDDAFFLKYTLERFKWVSFLLKDKFNPVVGKAAAVLAGNRYLAAFAAERNAVTHYLPTVVDTSRYIPGPRKRSDVFTVGWIGSPSTSVYLSVLSEPLEQLGREGPVRLLIVGGRAPDIPGVSVENVLWSEATEVDLINSFDVGVMPLFDDGWARGKCAFKLIQYMACGVPVVASPVGANLEVVNEACGLLADSSMEWLNALRRMRDELALRQSIGAAARQMVEDNYSLHSTLPKMANVIKAIVSAR